MEDLFSVYIDRLKDGKVEKISQTYTPDFIETEDVELSFKDPVLYEGEAYLADDELILHFNVDTYATIPCKICNEPVKVPIQIRNVYYPVSLSEIKGSIYSLKESLRETILLETPTFAECSRNSCPKRMLLNKYSEKMPPPENPFSKL
ncbi:MAG: hypothetical protein WD595_01380 [Waddliaceae bacterium]